MLAMGVVALWPAFAAGDPSPAAHPGLGTDSIDKRLVPGSLDAASGTFQKLEAQADTVTRNGTIKIVGTIQLNAGIPMNAPISVYAEFRRADAATINDIFSASVTAKRTGPHTATFTTTVPFTWSVPKGVVTANLSANISTSAPSAGGTTISWSGVWGTVVTLPPNGKTLTVKANAAV